MPHDPDSMAAEIFADALDIPPEDRSSFVEKACGGDADLRAEVESLLRIHVEARAVFDRPLCLAPCKAHSGLWLGRRIGPYRLTQHIATGGMGMVFAGDRTDQEYLSRVAVKIIRPGMDTAEILRRFRIERQILANLSHPHIARLLDGGSTQEGLPYIILEYVDGIPIDQYCNFHRFPVRSRIRLFLHILGAIHYAHQNLVIHRDLKPSNILVDVNGHAKVIDFGIAKVLEPEEQRATSGTQTVIRALTPRYASPEQLRGETPTTAADVYSLGVILYVLLTGRFPYNMTGRSAAEFEQVVCRQTPLRPSRAASDQSTRMRHREAPEPDHADPDPARLRGVTLRRLRRILAGDLDTILLKSISKEPHRRYASADAFATDLKRYLDGRPVMARPDSATYRLATFARRNKAVSVTVLTLLLVLVTGFLTNLSLYHREQRRARQAEELAYISSIGAGQSLLLLGQVAEARRRLDAAPVALRGWEWPHLHGRLDRSLKKWQAHDTAALDCAISPNGRLLATCSMDSTVRLWEMQSGALLRAWGPLGNSMESVALNPIDATVVAGSASGEVFVLSTTGEDVQAIHPPDIATGPKSWALVDVRSDGNRIAAGFMDGSLIEWDRHTGECIHTWRAHSSLALPQYFPSGRFLASGGADGRLCVWDSESHELVKEIRGHTQRIFSLAVSPDEQLVATGSADRTANVWRWRLGSLLRTFQGHRGTVTNICFLPVTSHIASTSADGSFLRWNAETGNIVGAYLGHESDIGGAAIDAEGSALVSADWSGAVRSWHPLVQDVQAFTIERVGGRFPSVAHCAFDTATRRVACATIADRVHLWDLDNPDSTCRLFDSGKTRRLAFSRGGDALLCGTEDGAVLRLDTASGQVERSIQAHHGPILCLKAGWVGHSIMTSSTDSLIKLWQASDLSLLREFRIPCDRIHDIEVSPDTKHLAVAGGDGTVRLHMLRTGEEVWRNERRGWAVADVAFSPDSRLLATACMDGSASVLDAATGSSLLMLIGPGASARAITWCRNGTRIAVGGVEGNIRLFDGASGREVLDLHGHYGSVSFLEFVMEDRYLLSGSRDGSIRLWESVQQTETTTP